MQRVRSWLGFSMTNFLARFLTIALIMCAMVHFGPTADAAERQFGLFSVDSEHPEAIHMDGALDAGSALNFRRALNAAPDARILVLNSPGGLVQMGLLIADDVHLRKMATLIPAGSTCASACAFIFLAGAERRADGQLGVHQVSNDVGDLESAQLSIADIIEVLNRFQTPIDVLTIMFKTPANDMHFFSPSEVALYGINRSAGATPAAGPPTPVNETPSVSSLPTYKPATAEAAAPATPSVASLPTPDLSTLEAYTRRPTRMALYSGLDFNGQDIESVRVGEASQCARRCFEIGSECKAFTYNADTRITRGPNCFLKTGSGAMDGNVMAISGLLLNRAEKDPAPFSMGIIDPREGMIEDIDLPGRDLSPRAHPTAKTGPQCRLACITNDQCQAFTFIKRKKECWLKSSVGEARYKPGMVSGGKKLATFSPMSVIALE
jgi:hypothetical protein